MIEFISKFLRPAKVPPPEPGAGAEGTAPVEQTSEHHSVAEAPMPGAITMFLTWDPVSDADAVDLQMRWFPSSEQREVQIVDQVYLCVVDDVEVSNSFEERGAKKVRVVVRGKLGSRRSS